MENTISNEEILEMFNTLPEKNKMLLKRFTWYIIKDEYTKLNFEKMLKTIIYENFNVDIIIDDDKIIVYGYETKENNGSKEKENVKKVGLQEDGSIVTKVEKVGEGVYEIEGYDSLDNLKDKIINEIDKINFRIKQLEYKLNLFNAELELNKFDFIDKGIEILNKGRFGPLVEDRSKNRVEDSLNQRKNVINGNINLIKKEIILLNDKKELLIKIIED